MNNHRQLRKIPKLLPVCVTMVHTKTVVRSHHSHKDMTATCQPNVPYRMKIVHQNYLDKIINKPVHAHVYVNLCQSVEESLSLCATHASGMQCPWADIWPYSAPPGPGLASSCWLLGDNQAPRGAQGTSPSTSKAALPTRRRSRSRGSERFGLSQSSIIGCTGGAAGLRDGLERHVVQLDV